MVAVTTQPPCTIKVGSNPISFCTVFAAQHTGLKRAQKAKVYIKVVYTAHMQELTKVQYTPFTNKSTYIQMHLIQCKNV